MLSVMIELSPGIRQEYHCMGLQILNMIFINGHCQSPKNLGARLLRKNIARARHFIEIIFKTYTLA